VTKDGQQRQVLPALQGAFFPLTDAAGWEALREAFADLEQTRAFEAVLAAARTHEPTFALLEAEYLDPDFLDEYVNYYASTYRPIPNRCRRLHFFAEDAYLGFCVLRPISTRPVGRTVLVPPPGLRPYVSCTVPVIVRPYGQRVAVQGFPYMEQDAQYGVCAHASVWMVARYHHLVHRTPKVMMSQITQAAAGHPELLRTTPSDGLTEKQVSWALQQIGIPAIPYIVGNLPKGQHLAEVLCRYLNSRLPVILTTDNHVTVLVGYGRDANGRLFYIRADESLAPYQRVYASDDVLGIWSVLFVPMPGQIHVSGELAEAQASTVFASLLATEEHRDLRKRLGPKLRLRSYVAQSGDYKVRLRSRGVPAEVIDSHIRVGAPKWIWIVELQDPDRAKTSRQCVLGEVAFDATSDPSDPHPLFGNLPGDAYVWGEPNRRPPSFDAPYVEPYLSGTAIHDLPHATPVRRGPGVRVSARALRVRMWARRAKRRILVDSR
jgi:hypothetical protein